MERLGLETSGQTQGTTSVVGYPVHAQVYDAYPWTAAAYPFGWERTFDGIAASEWTAEHWTTVLWVAIPTYLVAVFAGRAALRACGHSGFGLRPALVAWNWLLALFSALGALRLVPHLAMTIERRGLYFAICAEPRNSYGNGASGLWTFLFIYSKLPELVDTAFIVLRAKPLRFLHWYHHVTVLAYVMHSYATKASPGLWFCSLNLVVHALMYSYYALAAMGRRPRWAFLLTLLQIAQMVVGMSLAAAVYSYWSAGLPCFQTPENLAAGLSMYASYFVLFTLFALNRYYYAPKTKSE